ncbi:hypothetical protein PoB_005268200 [Plakobranchus ocellatus]|uniref:Uncharacterized protein n=1 Tax=Plakobranchus ocellatus TaxID=259542 RepID=A0AAV4C4G8_9GAST|nr:hypothetical protein PoB_005268200 [Plakobranchus ocellatus]
MIVFISTLVISRYQSRASYVVGLVSRIANNGLEIFKFRRKGGFENSSKSNNTTTTTTTTTNNNNNNNGNSNNNNSNNNDNDNDNDNYNDNNNNNRKQHQRHYLLRQEHQKRHPAYIFFT